MGHRDLRIRTPGRWQRAAIAAGLVSSLVVALAWAASLDYLSDDAFISFRYARNLATGQGLVYNPGERVEGYTNFLEVVVLAGLHRIGVDLVAGGRGLSLSAGVACVLLAWAMATRALCRWPALALVAPVLVAVNPYHAAWAAAGLETTLFSALLAGAALPLLGAETTRRSVMLVSGLALLLALTRPEGVVLFVVLAACAASASRGDVAARVRAVGVGLLLFGVVGGVYFAARWAYFGDVLPNTFHAKSAFTLNHARRGLDYVLAFAANPFVQCAGPLVLAGAWTALRRRLLPLLAVPVAILLIVVAEGGDGLPMYRFLVPAIPFFACLVALGVELAAARLGARAGILLGLAVVAVVSVLSFYPNRDSQFMNFVYQRNYEVPAWSAAGRALGRAYPPGTKLAAVPIGAVGYYSGLHVIDMVGLTDRTVARTAVADMGAGWAGHEKHNGPYVLSRRPEVLLLGNVYVDARPTLPEGGFPPWSAPAVLARERDVVMHPAFAREYEPRQLPVAPGLWLHYFARRDSGNR